VTVAVRERRPVFGDPGMGSAAVDVLRARASRTGVAVHGYCVMPDHVHLVVSPSATCDIVTFVGQFKNLTQRATWARGAAGPLWQRSFWDHFLRADEDLLAVVPYVLENPVRAGLVSCWRDYPFSGSVSFDLADL
jgi:REP element-mobilizing transposase RayT